MERDRCQYVLGAYIHTYIPFETLFSPDRPTLATPQTLTVPSTISEIGTFETVIFRQKYILT